MSRLSWIPTVLKPPEEFLDVSDVGGGLRPPEYAMSASGELSILKPSESSTRRKGREPRIDAQPRGDEKSEGGDDDR